MIDLSRTRRELLAQIEARDGPDETLSDITDPRIATTDVHVLLSGRGREDLFPLLKLALSERFRAVPRLNLIWDLLMPLKNALGNAYKHGNATDPAKAVSVEMVLTRKGAFIAVSDQGPGFDVGLTLRRFLQQQVYFEHFGIGFRNLHRAKATVSYENGGRTVLLCYRPVAPRDCASFSYPASAGDSGTAPEEFPGRGDALQKVLDAGWMQTCLSAELPEFGSGHARVQSCRIYATRRGTGDDCGDRYALRVATHEVGPAKTRILTGRVHATDAAAKVDFEAAASLHEAKLSKSLRRPRPVARPAAEPRLVLYDFDPWMNLWEYHTYRGSLKYLRRFAAKTGRALARLHRSPIVFPEVETGRDGAGLQAMVARGKTTLQTLPSGPHLVNRFHACVEQIQQKVALRQMQALTPIHGALGWDSIHYGVDGKFYLYRFEKCGRSDPGLDLGGFAADLLCFTLATYNDAAYRLCSDSLLVNYNSRTDHPIGKDELCFYIVLALCERLQRAEFRTKVGYEQLLAALDAALPWGQGCRE